MLGPALAEIYETNTNLVNFKYRASERYEVSFVDDRTSAEMQFYIYVPCLLHASACAPSRDNSEGKFRE